MKDYAHKKDIEKAVERRQELLTDLTKAHFDPDQRKNFRNIEKNLNRLRKKLENWKEE